MFDRRNLIVGRQYGGCTRGCRNTILQFITRYVVIPTVGKAGFGIGGARGKGVLLNAVSVSELPTQQNWVSLSTLLIHNCNLSLLQAKDTV